MVPHAHPVPRRSLYYGMGSLCHLIFTLVFPFYSVALVVWFRERNLYRILIGTLAAPFFAFLIYFSIKRWPVIKKDRRLFLILTASTILYITLYETVPDLGEKLHVLNFSVLALLIYKTLSPLMKLHWALLIAWAVASVTGVVDESLQNFIPGRAGTLHDMWIAVRSAILGGMIAWIFDAYSRHGRS